MVQFRAQAREIVAKIVYYGPPLGGKTTNLRTLYKGYPADTRGELVVVPAGGDRTIFFDFLPLDAGTLRGMKLRVQLYTVPGQVHYNATRQIVLRGVDAVVFVADSQRELLRANRDSWEDLKNNLLLQGLTLADLPHVLQYNKRDLSDILPVEELDAALNEYNAPFFEAVATVGIGVEETLQNVVKLLARSLRDRFKLGLDTQGMPTDLVSTLPPLGDERRGVPVQKPPVAASFPAVVAANAMGGMVREAAETTRVKVGPLKPPEHEGSELPVAPRLRLQSAPAPQPELVEQEIAAVETPLQAPPSQPPEVSAPAVVAAAPSLSSEPSEPPPLDDPFALPSEPLPSTSNGEVFSLPPRMATAFELTPQGTTTTPFSQTSEATSPSEPAPPAAEEEGETQKATVPTPAETAAIQKAAPFAIAQMGEVRELEVEVPVPAVWTGGKRMTLQLRLTLVPQPDKEPEDVN